MGGPLLRAEVTGTTLTLAGELDISTRPVLARAGQELLLQCLRPASPEAVVDADGLSFVDASGIGALVGLSTTLEAAGLRLRIVRPSRQLRRLTGLCHLQGRLGVSSDDNLDGVRAVTSP